MAQQQHSNPIAPQKIGTIQKMGKKGTRNKKKKLPSFSKVEKSIRKTMGY